MNPVDNMYNCRNCGIRSFETERGLRQHERHCMNNFASQDNNDLPSQSQDAEEEAPGRNVEQEFRNAELRADQIWGPHSVDDVSQIINAIYEETVKMRKNLFTLPSGSAGKGYVKEMTRMIELWNNDTSLKPFSLKGLMIMPTLLLQKPSYRSKAKEHSQCLERRLRDWKAGNFDKIMNEVRAIQSKLDQTRRPMSPEHLAKTFSKLILLGKINAALKLINKKILLENVK